MTTQLHEGAPHPKAAAVVKAAAVSALVAAALALLWWLDAARFLVQFVEWTRAAGLPGMLAFFGVYVFAAVFLLPASVLTLGAGFVWGPFVGLAVVMPSSLAAATTAFLLGRTVARPWVEKRMAANPRFRAIDEAVGSGGLRLVMLLRLSPVFPFNLLNYALGLTRVSLRDYVLGSLVGMVPGTLLYLYLGSLVTSASQLLSGQRPSAGPLGVALYLVGAIATVVVTVWVARSARRALERTLELPRGQP